MRFSSAGRPEGPILGRRARLPFPESFSIHGVRSGRGCRCSTSCPRGLSWTIPTGCWALALGLLAGAANVIPYVGSAVALVAGLTYTLLADEIHPLLPMITAENAAVWLIVGVMLAELLKNVVYEPLVLGGAAKLHPLVVVIGVLGGGLLFGLAGVLLAIPTITIAKAFASSASTQLKAYGLI